ncbi:MAG: choice-of-anchor D domain-containing protein, partial [Flavobacteriales bacterium]|nr:choice-of-anchor D domain-containing protein [Flavobacteriales bacterium]
HVLSVSNPSKGIARVVIYSSNNSNLSGNSGNLLTLKFNSITLPGNFSFTFSDMVFSSSSGTTVEATSESGSVKVLGPILKINTSNIDFGRVPIGDSPTRNIYVRNDGNQTLELTASSDISPFDVIGGFPISINAGSSKNISVSVNTDNIFDDTKELTFDCNDADALRKTQKVNIKANVYSVNEIHIGTGAGEIDKEVSIPVSINNMDEFSGFQFDVILPTGIEYVVGGIVESSRFNGHVVTASVIDGNKVRFIAYSSTNSSFTGIDGEVFSFKLKPKVSSGTYYLQIKEATISDSQNQNSISDSFNGSIRIKAPNLSVSPSNVNFGDTPITETRDKVIRLNNYG